jgi:Isochorismatase family.
MKAYTLLIIDMQAYFKAARSKRVQEEVSKEMRQAIQDNMPIIFLEYIGCGSSVKKLTKNIEFPNQYYRSYVIGKNDDDGAREVMVLLKSFRLPKNHIKVCGVNTSACVFETVVSLRHKLKSSKIELLVNACNDESKSGHHSALEAFKTYHNVSLNAGKRKAA